MQRILIDSPAHPAFPAFLRLYTASFPLDEQRRPDEIKRILSRADYHVEAWMEGDGLLGFLAWWDCPGVRYIEHYAIDPARRGGGCGSKFLTEWIADGRLPVLLEIEPATDETSRRREVFYQRLGFVRNPFSHGHPSYHDGTGWVDLWIMTWPQAVSEEKYLAFREKFRGEILPKFP